MYSKCFQKKIFRFLKIHHSERDLNYMIPKLAKPHSHIPNIYFTKGNNNATLPARESLVSDVPAGDGNIANLFTV
jgi:hypothetical protein